MSTFTRKKQLHIAGTIGLSIGAVIAASNPASAHMGIDTFGQTFTAGKGATVYLRPGHGCNATGDSTNTITVTLPDGVTGAKAQQKPGWITSQAGNTITWTGGSLPTDQFDDFGIRLTLPVLPAGVKSQALYFRSVQVCDAELKVTTSGNQATIMGTLPAYAGKSVQLFVNDIPLTKHDVTVGSNGAFTVTTSATKIPAGADVQAKIHGRLVGNSTPGQEAWLQTPDPANPNATLASPAPSVTITA